MLPKIKQKNKPMIESSSANYIKGFWEKISHGKNYVNPRMHNFLSETFGSQFNDPWCSSRKEFQNKEAVLNVRTKAWN